MFWPSIVYFAFWQLIDLVLWFSKYGFIIIVGFRQHHGSWQCVHVMVSVSFSFSCRIIFLKLQWALLHSSVLPYAMSSTTIATLPTHLGVASHVRAAKGPGQHMYVTTPNSRIKTVVGKKKEV